MQKFEALSKAADTLQLRMVSNHSVCTHLLTTKREDIVCANYPLTRHGN